MTTAASSQAPDLRSRAKRVAHVIAHRDVFFWSVSWLMVLLVAGTLAQRDVGLFLASEKYFSSWLLWAGPVPLPGGRFTMAVIITNLLFKLVFRSPWTKAHSGIIITHLGSLILLGGGILTAWFSAEGRVVIPEGGRAAFVEDDFALEIALIDRSPAEHDSVVSFSGRWLSPGGVMTDEQLPVSIKVLEQFGNVTTVRRSEAAPEGLTGFARSWVLKAAPPEKESERNRAGAIVEVTNTATGARAIYALIDGLTMPQQVQLAGRSYDILLRHKQTPLPFAIELVDFEKKTHAGTQMAKSYRSTVNLVEGGVSRRVIIQMNEPLRHGGYTFYQSSYIETPQGDSTVLAAVKNAGRVWPYVSSLVMCFGLLIHLLLQVPRQIRRATASGSVA